jgi:hypothetical protein
MQISVIFYLSFLNASIYYEFKKNNRLLQVKNRKVSSFMIFIGFICGLISQPQEVVLSIALGKGKQFLKLFVSTV